jgi:hypothetical protein
VALVCIASLAFIVIIHLSQLGLFGVLNESAFGLICGLTW